MKNFNFKSILLGIGVGVILTSIISMIYLAGNDVLIDDEEIVKRAQELGMVQAYASNEKGIAEKKVNAENTKKSEGSENKKSVENKDDLQDKNIEKKATEIKATEIKATPAVKEKKIIVQAGDTSEIVSEKLKSAGLIKDTNAFNDMMDEMGVSDRLTIGEYTIKSGTDMKKIINILTAGG